MQVIESGPKSFHSLRRLLKRFNGHDFYKCAGEAEIEKVGTELWALSEDELKRDIMKEMNGNASYDNGDGVKLVLYEDDFIVEKRELHCGSKDDNPVAHMRFFSKSDNLKLKSCPQDLPEATEVDETSLPMNTLKQFMKRSIRLYSRSSEKNELLAMAFENWRSHRIDRLAAPAGCSLKTFMADGDDDVLESQQSHPNLLTQDNEMTTPVPKKAKRKLGL